jgi:hypothetical protein
MDSGFASFRSRPGMTPVGTVGARCFLIQLSNSPRHSRPKDGVASLAYTRITPASWMQA